MLKLPIAMPTIAALFGLSLLSACGGGGGGGGGGIDTSVDFCKQFPARTATQVQLHSAAGISANHYVSSGSPINDQNAFTNGMRAELGLPELSITNGLNSAASNHSNYMALNQVLSHEESAGLPGYTAASPFDRIKLYYDPPLIASGEVASSMSGVISGDLAIRGLFDAPLHRVLMLSEYAVIGSGYVVGKNGVAYTTQNYANYKAGIADFAIVAYPYAGASEISTRWFDSEYPDPLEGTPYSRTTVGYPITLQANVGSELTLGSIKLYANCNTEVSLTARSHAIDPQIVEAPNMIVATPNQVLASNTVYTVRATGYYTSSSRSLYPFDLRWQFTTR
jgi:uncharacterized protein YkwD